MKQSRGSKGMQRDLLLCAVKLNGWQACKLIIS